MKKIVSVLMVAVALMMAAPAQAQLIKFGVKGGMNFSELDFEKKSWGDINESRGKSFAIPFSFVFSPKSLIVRWPSMVVALFISSRAKPFPMSIPRVLFLERSFKAVSPRSPMPQYLKMISSSHP